MAEALQDQFVRSVEWATKALGLPLAAPWMLQDHDSGAFPSEKQTTNDQSRYGLLRADGDQETGRSEHLQIFSTGIVATQFNGFFADESSGQPLAWTSYDATQGVLSWDGAVSHSGYGSVSLSNTGGAPPRSPPTRRRRSSSQSAPANPSEPRFGPRVPPPRVELHRHLLVRCRPGLSRSEPVCLASCQGHRPGRLLAVTSAAPLGAAYERSISSPLITAGPCGSMT